MGSTQKRYGDLSPSRRNPSDVTMLLLELERALRGRRFYPEGNEDADQLLDRSWRIWREELERHGALELEILHGGVWLPVEGAPVGRGRVDGLARRLNACGIRRAGFDANLEMASFRGLIDLLLTEPDVLEQAGGAPSLFHASGQRPGIRLGGAQAKTPSPEAPPQPEEIEAESEPPAEAGSTAPDAPQGTSKPDPAVGRLSLLVRELGEAGHGASHYAPLCDQVVQTASGLVERGQLDEALRAFRLLSLHAGDDVKHSAEQRSLAARALQELVSPSLLACVLDRACASDVEVSLEATAWCLQLGAAAVPALLDAFGEERDPGRRRRLSSLVVALAEVAAPLLAHALETGPPRRVRSALHLAGETQHPELVPGLRRLALGRDPELGREAVRALVQIGSQAALDVLAEMAHSPRSGPATSGAVALGATGRVQAVAPLLATANRALADGRAALALDAVRALSRHGCPAAVSALARILDRRALRRRRSLRELKLAVIAALVRRPEAEAQEALERAARGRDARVRRAALLALERRAASGSPS